MKIAGSYSFPASREEVWEALNDPHVLARAIPGCQKLDQVGESEYESTLKIGQGVVKGVYSGRVRIDDMQPPEHYRIEVDGKGSNGFMKGSGTIDLIADASNETTQLKYAGEAQVGGTIASVGQRLIEGAAKSLINQSLKSLTQQIEARKNGGSAASDDQQAATATAQAAEPAEPAEPVAASEAEPTDGNVDPPEKNRDPFISEAAMTGDPDSGGTADSGAEAPPVSQDLPSMVEPAQQTDSAPPATTTLLSTNPAPAPSRPAAAPSAASDAGSSSFQPRTIVVPEHERLSEGAVVQGMITDFISERPWLPWVVVAFLLGFLLGRRT